jgi:hypothetical protein
MAALQLLGIAGDVHPDMARMRTLIEYCPMKSYKYKADMGVILSYLQLANDPAIINALSMLYPYVTLCYY